METQDQKNPNQLGHEGHSGVHPCHKCGWPFPNPHPSGRHRRAHKRVCGTIEGYTLDSSQDNKTHLAGSDGEHVSDDDHKITSDKLIERTISRKSSSGVGSRSSRSTRSEDEVFADAVTEFSDGMGSEIAFDGIMSRGNSLQNITENDPEGFKLSSENGVGDDSSASNIVLVDKQLGTVCKNEEVKAQIPSQDQISSSINCPAVISALVIRENENAADLNVIQSSGTSSGVNTGDDKEIAESDNLSELKIPCSGTAEDVSEQVSALVGVNEELLDSISAGGTVKLTGMQGAGLEERFEGSNTVDSPGNFHHSLNPAQEVNSTDRNPGNSLGMVEEHDPKIEANETADLQDVFDALLVQEHLEMAPDDLHDKVGESGISMEVEAPSAVDSMEHILKQEARQTTPIAEQDTVGGLDQISVLKASDGDISGTRSEEVHEEIRDEAWEDQEVSNTEERKTSVSSEKVFPEVATTDGDHDQETSLYGGANAIDVVNGDRDIVIHENDSSKVPVEEEVSLISSTMAECSIDDIAPQDKKLMNVSDINDVGNVEKVGVNEMTVGLEEVNEHVTAEPATGCGFTIARLNDDNEGPRTNDRDVLGKILDLGNLTGSHSPPESGLTPQGVREAQSASENIGGRECMNKVDNGPVVETDDGFDSTLKTSADAASFCPSSAVAVGSCTEQFVELASDTESEKTIKQHIAVSVVDIMDSSGQTDHSKESSSQPVSDTVPANRAVSNSSEACAEPEAVRLEPKGMEEVQYPDNKASTEPLGLEKIENTSEIQVFENQKQTALKTLLGEAIAKSRAESPNYDEIPAKNPNAKVSEEMGREWNSPARYPVKIKTEKRRAKSKSSYWMPFLCCSNSSVNASGP